MSSTEPVLDQDALCNFGMAKVFKYNNCVVNGLDIDDSGRYLVTTSTDNCVRLYDCLDAKLRKTIECNQFGASCIQFTHHSKSVLLASHDGITQSPYYSLLMTAVQLQTIATRTVKTLATLKTHLPPPPPHHQHQHHLLLLLLLPIMITLFAIYHSTTMHTFVLFTAIPIVLRRFVCRTWTIVL